MTARVVVERTVEGRRHWADADEPPEATVSVSYPHGRAELALKCLAEAYARALADIIAATKGEEVPE
jgi:hypothetical protein